MAAGVLHQGLIQRHLSMLVEKINNLVSVDEIFPKGFVDTTGVSTYCDTSWSCAVCSTSLIPCR